MNSFWYTRYLPFSLIDRIADAIINSLGAVGLKLFDIGGSVCAMFGHPSLIADLLQGKAAGDDRLGGKRFFMPLRVHFRSHDTADIFFNAHLFHCTGFMHINLDDRFLPLFLPNRLRQGRGFRFGKRLGILRF
jgi:hypothetical protein